MEEFDHWHVWTWDEINANALGEDEDHDPTEPERLQNRFDALITGKKRWPKSARLREL
jgi:hypothetical protein